MKRVISTRGEWAITVGLTIIVVAGIAQGFFPEAVPDYESRTLTLAAWRSYQQHRTLASELPGVVKLIGSIILASSLIITSNRMLRIKLKSLKGVIYFLAGISICAFHILSSYFIMTFDTSIATPSADIILHNIETHQYNPKLKSKLYKNYAQSKYRWEGKIVEYLDENGSKVRYLPTKEEIKDKEQEILGKEIWRELRASATPNFYLWLTTTLISLLLGIFTPIRKVTTPEG